MFRSGSIGFGLLILLSIFLVGSTSAKDGPFGNCPDIYYTSSKDVDGATVTWRSSFGGYDYDHMAGGSYDVTVEWSVTGGSAVFVRFEEKGKTWTPKSVNGSWSNDLPIGDTMGLSVTMSAMHRSVEPNWQGYIGNAHFKLVLRVNGVLVKLGVNVHLEDPDLNNPTRCPSTFTKSFRQM